MNESSTDNINPASPSAAPPADEAISSDALTSTPVIEHAPAQTPPAQTPISVDGLVNASATEALQAPAVSPLPDVPTPPRALTPGAFLRGEIEVRSVVSRGLTNIYEAAMGDYGAMSQILLAERETSPQATVTDNSTEAEPPSVTWQNVDTSSVEASSLETNNLEVGDVTSSTRAAAESSLAANATEVNAIEASAPTENSSPDDILTVDEMAESGAFVEDVDTLPNEEVAFVAPAANSEPVANSAIANVVVDHFSVAAIAANETIEYSKEIETPTLEEAASLFVAGETFAQEDREYKIFDHFASTALQDWREPTNDERVLKMLHAVAQGLTELQRSNHRAQFTTETLRVDAKGDLRFLGFVESGAFDALGELRRVAAFLLKQTFAEAATMRLDDQYGALAFSEELKSIARRLDAAHPHAFQNLQEAASAIAFYTSSTRLRADFALQTDVGREREINEDSGLIMTTNRQATLNTHAWELYVVADGMGGHEGGEVASDLTLSSLVRNLEAQAIDYNDNVAVRNALFQVIDAVNAEVVALTETPKYKGTRAKPGSTLTFGLRVGARVFVGNVGDSRTYKYANRVLERVSKDHSYVQTLIDAGDITEDEAFTHPDGSVITAHIGYPKLKQRDVFLRLFRAGETLLLVSDGVTDMLRDAEYEAHLGHHYPEDVCRAFVDAANEAGGADNITVVCVKFR